MPRTTGPWIVSLAALPLLVLGLQAQAGLPATAPTTGSSQQSVSQLPSAQAQGNDAATAGDSTRPDVAWDGHLLQVSGKGATLQETLRRVAAETHTRLIGNVPTDRVYGSYGPAPLAVVIAALTDGLPVNILFVDSTGMQPPQLTLTARNGATTPAEAGAQQQAYEAPRAVEPPRRGPGSFGGSPTTAAIGGAPPIANPAAVPDSGNTNADSGNPASPTGVRTPQEIFEQLQRLRAAAGANRQ